MFQEKLKSRLLRPLLLLAAVLALSQTASAWDHYYLRSSGGDNNADYNRGIRHELTWNGSGYYLENFVLDSDCNFKITCRDNNDSENTDNGWYGPSNGTTVDKTMTLNLQGSGNDILIKAGTYSVLVETDQGNQGWAPTKVKFTKKVVSESGDMPVSELNKFWMRGNWGANDYGWSADGQVMFNADGTVSIVKSASNFQCKVGWGETVEGNTGGWIQPGDMVLSDNIKTTGSGDETNLSVPLCPVGKTMKFTLSFDGNTPHLDVTWDGVVDYDPTKFNGGEVLFLEIGNDNGWHGDGATFWAEFYDGTTTKKVQFINVSGTNYYRLTVPEGKWPGLNLLRRSPDGNTHYNSVNSITPPSDRANNCIVKDQTGNNGWQWDSAIHWTQVNISTVEGMPFYPVGITNERDFKALPADKRFYYLAGHNINSGKISPEWQLIETGPGTGVYTLDFTYNYHPNNNVGGGCSNPGYANKLSIQYLTPASDSNKAVEDADNLTPPAPKTGWERAGVRMRVTFTESSKNVKFDYLAFDGLVNGKAQWKVVSNNADATYLPFISLVADGWSQPVTSDIYVANESAGGTQRPENWQNAWIQYDENGDIVYSRDNNAVYYNTQWPPVNPVYIEKSFTLNGKERDLVMDSDNLAFVYTGESKTGSQWKATDEYSKIAFNTSHGVSADTKAGTTYRQYVVEDIWATGRFKIWSGWSGARFSSGAAEWSKNWNWGQENGGASNANPYVVDINSPTVFLGNENGDMMFGKIGSDNQPVYEPTYFKRVTFFMAVDEDGGVIANDNGRSFLFFEPSYANLRIQALNNEDYSAGTFLPQIDPDLVPGQEITRVTLNLYRSSDDSQVQTLMNVLNQHIDPAHFNQAFDTNSRFTASDYNDGYYNDGFRYQAAGYYYYTLTVTFKDGTKETVETVRSNPFFVAVAPATLITSQLVEIVRDVNGKAVEERFNDYRYVTYTPGTTYEWGYLTDEAYAERKANWQNYPGRDATGLGRYGYRIERINMNPSSKTSREFYADADKARWTSKVLIFALRPWKGETPSQVLAEQGAHGAYWRISYNAHRNHNNWNDETVDNPDRVYYYGKVREGATNAMDVRQSDAGDFFEGAVTDVNDLVDEYYDSPLEWIKEGVCIYEHEFKCQLHYYVSAEENTLISTSDESTDNMQLRIPTPRMHPDLFSATMEDLSKEGENYGKITISAADHSGNVTDEIDYEDHEYDNPRVRTIRFGAYMDMPNATPELISLIPDTGTPATAAEKACGKMGNYWRECEIDCAEDEGFEQLFDGTWLNVKDMRPTRFRFLNQDPNYWLKYNAETNQYDPIQRNITFDFAYDGSGNGEILFFPRRAGGVTLSLKSELAAPEFVKDETQNVKAMVYSVIVPKKGETNKYEERLIFANAATGLGEESYLELPGEDNPDQPVRIPFAVNTDKAYYMFRLGGKLPVVREEKDGPWKTQNYFAHHADINKGTTLYTVKCVDRGSWWDGMDSFSMVKEDFDIEIAHAHIFYVNRSIDFQHMHTDGKWATGGAVSKTPDIPADAPRRAPRRAPGDGADMDEHYVGFTSPSAVENIPASNIMTGVATVTAAQSIISGKGFIDLNGNDGIIYSTDATLVYQGNGRTEVPAGIYLVKTAGETYKIAVQ